MTTEHRVSPFAVWLVALWLGFAAASPAAKESFSLAYVQLAADPFYEPHRAYTGLRLRDRHRPLAGARTALRESRVIGRVMGLELNLLQYTLAPGEHATDAIRALQRTEGVRVFLLDLPIEEVQSLAKEPSPADLILFNIRHSDDQLRGRACASNLFHTIPSRAMMMDALAQFLSKKNWREVLILEGQEKTDRVLSQSFQSAAKKFGLDVVGVRPFVLGKNPRERDQNNIALLTGGGDHDVVFVADSLGEVGRYVPYSTQKSRPVVGSEGLSASAWHWTWERHGAPQLNQRFDRVAGRRMMAPDYAAWAAVKSIVEAIARTQATEVATLRNFLISDDFTLDTYKGAPGNFRAWNNQLRQAILLHTHNAVIGRAPFEGFLHQHNNLDTLGVDKQETACELQPPGK